MRDHRWMGLGTAEFTDAQALEWATLDGATDAPLELNIAQVVCLICDAPYVDTVDGCPGPLDRPARHRWVSMMTVAMTPEEAAGWADPAPMEGLDVRPRSTNLLCALCGQPYEQAEDACPERAFWISTGSE
ncbi:MAG: hypothetical protein WD206_01525 [Actinomycetota bacterium]